MENALCRLVRPLIRIGRGIVRRLTPDEVVLRRRYRMATGRSLNLTRPRDFSEKLLWLQLNAAASPHRRCADRFRLRGYVAQRLGETALVPLIDCLESADALRPERVGAQPFVARTSHDGSPGVICRDPAAFDWDAARQALGRRMRRDRAARTGERAYRAIRPRILVEEMLPATPAAPPCDFRFWCFAGRVEFVTLVFTLESRTRSCSSVFDRDWKRLPLGFGDDPVPFAVGRPHSLDTMIAMAERLAAPLPFCRVDLSEAMGRIYVTDVSFSADDEMRRLVSDVDERRIGDMLHLPLVDRHRPSAASDRSALLGQFSQL